MSGPINIGSDGEWQSLLSAYLRMRGALLLALVAAVQGQCVVESAGKKFNFTSLISKQLTFDQAPYTYQFAFCQPLGPCGSAMSSSLCQSYSPYQYTLGLWSGFKDWTSSVDGQLTGTLIGEECDLQGFGRVTTVTFQCADGPAAILSMEETKPCYYSMVIQVPRAVCSSSCCVPPTYTSTRLGIGGTKSVVQRDGATGDWFDGNYQERGQCLLCSAYYNRCFTYSPSLTSCVGSAYRPAPVQCFGSPDWSSVGQHPLSESNPIPQTVWVSNLDKNYVVTMPLGSGSSCVQVSGSAVDTSVGFSLTPDASLWELPPICLKDLK